ncbi:thioredoxin family protein [Blastococcus litoris]|uniref:thioredoxin family protein n=1 Tax=Blastococcus litoris TaxID=2171622 RepID=UPI000E300FD9|nr:thioredoxin domain-containing protein [Blastococcus litoris]
MAGTLPTTSDATFRDDVLTSDLPVLVEFTATWCPPCRMLAPVLARIAADLAGRLRIVAMDVDENPLTTRAYGVMGMPTMALFVDGEVVTTLTGARPQAVILKTVEPHLAAAAAR